MTGQPHPAPASPGPRIRIAGPAGDRPSTALVLGHSRDPASDTALHVAADLAVRLHAHLHVVHSVGLSDYPVDPDAADWDQQARDTLQAQRERVTAALADSPAGWTYHTGRGAPADLLAAIADDHDALMIIVGSRGEGAGAALERALAGSISRAVLHRQHRPVLIVPSTDP